MYIFKKSLVFACTFILLQISAETTQAQLDPFFNGQVVNEQDETLIGANVKWQNTDLGTSTDPEGWFKLERIDTINNYYLEITYVGYETQIVEILPSENFLKFYTDGVLTDSSTFGTNPNGLGSSLLVGGATTNSMYGDIASFSIYNRALSADEIRQNYLATKERYA